MLISEYLAGRSQISVSTGVGHPSYEPGENLQGSGEKAASFAEELKSKLGNKEVEFSSHAIKRLESRQALNSQPRRAAKKASSLWTARHLS